jgi:hypothetical protein
MAWPMANDPPFATLNHFVADLGIPEESATARFGIKRLARADRPKDDPTCGGAPGYFAR